MVSLIVSLREALSGYGGLYMEDYRKEKHSKSDRLRWNRAKVENFMFLPTFARKLINWLGGSFWPGYYLCSGLKGTALPTANYKGGRK